MPSRPPGPRNRRAAPRGGHIGPSGSDGWRHAPCLAARCSNQRTAHPGHYTAATCLYRSALSFEYSKYRLRPAAGPSAAPWIAMHLPQAWADCWLPAYATAPPGGFTGQSFPQVLPALISRFYKALGVVRDQRGQLARRQPGHRRSRSGVRVHPVPDPGAASAPTAGRRAGESSDAGGFLDAVMGLVRYVDASSREITVARVLFPGGEDHGQHRLRAAGGQQPVSVCGQAEQ